MKLLENRRFAAGVLAVCAVGSVFGFGGAHLSRERQNAMNVFTVGTDTSFSTTMSVDAYLKNSADYARTMIEEYRLRAGSEWEGQARVQSEMASIVSGAPGDRLSDYLSLVSDVESLYTDFHAAVPDDAAALDFDKAYKGFKSENSKIGYDEYHSLARNFNSDASGFPASAVAGLWNLSELDPFDL